VRTLLQTRCLVLIPETEAEILALTAWKGAQAGHVMLVHPTTGIGLALNDVGPRAEACREPLQVSSRSPEPSVRLISNFAATPFELGGRWYQSVESFWQGLKFDDPAERRRVAGLAGPAAQKAGRTQAYGATVTYEGRSVPVGTWQHWELMEQACRAKFAQNEEARAALLATGRRPLVHRMRRDSRTIPGVIMADIWMSIRDRLREGDPVPAADAEEVTD
jgi:predicted NAD-dependent protein-ADP-ribosyltransferase YbiA (DUF1768 family)